MMMPLLPHMLIYLTPLMHHSMSYHHMHFMFIFSVFIFRLILVSSTILDFILDTNGLCILWRVWAVFMICWSATSFYLSFISYLLWFSEIVYSAFMHVYKFLVLKYFKSMALFLGFMFNMVICLRFFYLFIFVKVGEVVEILSIFTCNKCLM